MTGTTATPLGLPYSTAGDAVSAHPARMLAQVTQLNTHLAGANSAAFSTVGSSGTHTFGAPSQCRRRAGLTVVTLEMTTVAAVAGGNLLLTLPAGFRPVAQQDVLLTNLSANVVMSMILQPTGTLSPRGNIASGATILGSFTFAVPI